MVARVGQAKHVDLEQLAVPQRDGLPPPPPPPPPPAVAGRRKASIAAACETGGSDHGCWLEWMRVGDLVDALNDDRKDPAVVEMKANCEGPASSHALPRARTKRRRPHL